ncbi:MAG: universal stress protein [Verrucomicrobia bacterium]|nr:universal stress protein [Verrucomicrobiota bacterium]
MPTAPESQPVPVSIQAAGATAVGAEVTITADSPAQGAGRSVEIGKILVPIDLTTASLAALDYAAALATRFGSKVHLLHVVESDGSLGGMDAVVNTRSEHKITVETQTQLRRLVERALPPSVPVEVEVDSGMVGLDIVRAAERVGSDLIILTTHGLRGLRHLFSRNAAEWVMRDAPCPVLLLHCAKPIELVLERDDEPGEPSGRESPSGGAA